MSVPLRKEELEDKNLTTADLAQGKLSVAAKDRLPDLDAADGASMDRLREDRLGLEREAGPSPVLVHETASERTEPVVRHASQSSPSATARYESAATSLFPAAELDDLRTRWSSVQTAFVDEPRSAVKQADGLVASAMKRLAEVFAEERSKLEQQWDRGDNVSTEELRVALQRYRSFFQRLLSI
jgi:hypothetical protein